MYDPHGVRWLANAGELIEPTVSSTSAFGLLSIHSVCILFPFSIFYFLFSIFHLSFSSHDFSNARLPIRPSGTRGLPMKPPTSRGFGIGDGLILIAGVAASLALCKALMGDITPQKLWDAFVRPTPGWSLDYAFKLTCELGVMVGIPLLAAWAPTCLILQLRKPRAPWRRLRRQPGFIACAIATTSLILIVGMSLGSACLGIRTNGGPEFLPDIIMCGLAGGSGVLASWTTLMLSGVCRRMPSWTDRLGRVVGAAWIGLGVLSTFYVLMAL